MNVETSYYDLNNPHDQQEIVQICIHLFFLHHCKNHITSRKREKLFLLSLCSFASHNSTCALAHITLNFTHDSFNSLVVERLVFTLQNKINRI